MKFRKRTIGHWNRTKRKFRDSLLEGRRGNRNRSKESWERRLRPELRLIRAEFGGVVLGRSVMWEFRRRIVDQVILR